MLIVFNILAAPCRFFVLKVCMGQTAVQRKKEGGRGGEGGRKGEGGREGGEKMRMGEWKRTGREVDVEESKGHV